MAKSKMKLSPKVLVIAAALIIAVGAGAVFFMGKNPGGESVMQNGENAFTSIRDALSRSISLECEITDSQGRTTKAYIKNGAVRADMEAQNPEDSGSMIMKDKMIYAWNGTQGFTMQIPDEANAMGEYEGQEENQGEQLLDDLENYKDNCKPAVVSDSLFTPPSDVTFTDMSKMMEGTMNEEELKKMMETYGGEGS